MSKEIKFKCRPLKLFLRDLKDSTYEQRSLHLKLKYKRFRGLLNNDNDNDKCFIQHKYIQ